MRSIYLWLDKPLGAWVLEYLLEHPLYDSGELEIWGVAISAKLSKHRTKIITLAEQAGIPVWVNWIGNYTLTADIGFTVGFPRKISIWQQKMCAAGIVNLHFGPLPRYPGSGTVHQALYHRELEYGLTLHYIDQNLDTGPIISQIWFELTKINTGSELIRFCQEVAKLWLPSELSRLVTKPLQPSCNQAYFQVQAQSRFTRSNLRQLQNLDTNLEWSEIFDRCLALDPKPCLILTPDKQYKLSISVSRH